MNKGVGFKKPYIYEWWWSPPVSLVCPSSASTTYRVTRGGRGEVLKAGGEGTAALATACIEGHGQSRKYSGVSGLPEPWKLCKKFAIQVSDFWAVPASWVPSWDTSWQACLNTQNARPASPDQTDVIQPYALFLFFPPPGSSGWESSNLWLAD